MAEEQATEATPLPPYFDRFIEERDRRLVAELGRLDTSIQHNAEGINGLRQEMERRFEDVERRLAEAKADRDAIRHEMREGFAEAKADRDAIRHEMREGFAEAKADRDAIRHEMREEFAGARDDRKAIRTELRSEINRLDAKIDSHFRVMMGVIIPIAVGILAIIIRIFFLGPIP